MLSLSPLKKFQWFFLDHFKIWLASDSEQWESRHLKEVIRVRILTLMHAKRKPYLKEKLIARLKKKKLVNMILFEWLNN